MWTTRGARVAGTALVASGLALLLAGCPVGIVVPSATLRFQFDCSFTGAVSPGYKWQYTVNGSDKNLKYGTVLASTTHKVVTTPNPISEVDFQFRSAKPMPDGHIECDAFWLETGKGAGAQPVTHHLGKHGPSRDKVSAHYVIEPKEDGSFGID